MKKKVVALVLCIMVCALAGCGEKTAPPEYPAPEPEKIGASIAVNKHCTAIPVYTSAEERLAAMTRVASDGGAALYFDTATCDVAFVSQKGFALSAPWNLAADTKSVDTQKQKIASQLRISYMDSRQTVSELFSFTECVSKGQYTLNKLDNGIQVKMVIGRAEQRTLLPAALSAESFEKLLEALSGRAVSRMKAFYKLYDADKTPENQIAIIKDKYPIVEETPIYVLKSVTDKEKGELEGYFAEAGYTFSDMEKDLKQLGIKEEETVSPRFVVTVRYVLSDGELKVSVPASEIEYDTEHFTLLEIGLLEYFAAADCTQNGYLFVPDGSGAVIGFNRAGNKLGNDVSIPVYGYDRSLTYNSGYDNLMTAPLGVFGISSPNGNLLGMIDEGAPNAEIIASSGGSSSGYARAGVIFNYSDYDTFEYKDVNTNYSWTLAEKNAFRGVFRISYAFVGDGGYSAMAAYYRERLNLKSAGGQSGLKVVLGVLGSVSHSDEFLFIPVKRQVPLTTFEDAGTIARELTEGGIANLDLRYIGWNSGGLDSNACTSASIGKTLGSKKKLKALNKTLAEYNVGLYFDAQFVYVANNGLFDGFTAVSDTARMLDKTFAGYNKTRLSSGLMNEQAFRYALRPATMLKFFNRFNTSYRKLGVSGLSLADLGSSLNSDKDIGRGMDRSSAAIYTNEILKRAGADYSLMIDGANGYGMDYASCIINTPSGASGYPDADYSVPFIQMILHGAVEYTSGAVNLSGDYHTEVLKAIENGSGLYFEIAFRNAELLKTSTHADYYSVDYTTWKDHIAECFRQVNEAIGDQGNAVITEHASLADGVSKVVYSSGTEIYINYNSEDYSAAGVTVPANGYIRTQKGE